MLKKFFGLTVGSLIYSLAIALFIDVHGLAPGGIGGIAILISRVVPVLDTGAWILILNIPLLIVGLVVFGKAFLASTVYTTVVSSILVDIISKIASPWLTFTDNMILAAIAGGGMLALGIGIVFRSGGTTGGVDILVKILRRKFRHMRTGALFMSVDVFVVIMTIPVMG
ncbi:MAG: YitT family protein, partial [Clostridia bacterium]|nr:YitT family protein [Clostridia bacterium]